MTSPSMRQLAEYLLNEASEGSFENGLNSVTSELLVSKRTKMVDNFLSHYFALLEQRGITSLVNVSTPSTLNATSRSAIRSALLHRLSLKNIDITYDVNPSLVTGFTASNYSRSIDNSGKQTLHALEEIN